MVRRSVGSRTIDGASALRCFAVALSPEQIDAVRRAIVPVEVVVAAEAREACASMSTVLPLVVVIDDDMNEADRTAISEMATACGAEIVALASTPVDSVVSVAVLEALRIAERRRLGMRA